MATPKKTVKKTADAKKPARKKAAPKRIKLKFKAGDFIVYPAHGMGKVIAVESETIAEMDIEVYVILFEQDKMTLRVPTQKVDSSGMRGLANDKVLKDAFTTLRGRPRVKRTMWSRRAQEYEGKINSGDLLLLTEVVRDLYRTEEQPDQSYSERQLYERAIDRMVREVSAIMKMDTGSTMDKIIETLSAARAKAAAKAAAKFAAENPEIAAAEAAAKAEAEAEAAGIATDAAAKI
ncbi:MAG: CarD family transcriptional regulator [Robiginitomaculum sp.]|nr:CarD family transcriptional regulator [Robiginitomaculum sp.]